MSTTNLLTSEEISKLAEFRKRTKKIYPEPDDKLLTWLRAREFNIEKSLQMLRRHLLWRKNNEIDTLLEWKSPKVYSPYIFLGEDLTGTPTFLCPFGHIDLRGAIESGDIVASFKFIFQSIELMINEAKKRRLYQGGIIFDFDGFSYHQITHRSVVQGLIELTRVIEANYPEFLKYGICINTPIIFGPLFSIVKPFINSRTISKIIIFNTDRIKWQDALFKLIPKDILPIYWGGTRIGKDEFCSDEWFQEPLPKFLMRSLGFSYDEYGQQWNIIKISAGEIITFDYNVISNSNSNSNLGKILRWEFYTESYDIEFGLTYYENKTGHKEEEIETCSTIIINQTRVDSHKTKKFGSIQLNKIGQYNLIFNNSYSRARAKILHYFIELMEPEDDEDDEDEVFDDAEGNEIVKGNDLDHLDNSKENLPNGTRTPVTATVEQ